jgi:antitoxin CcdA
MSATTMLCIDAPCEANQSQQRSNHRQWADACAADWNAVHAAVGSFADEHSTL